MIRPPGPILRATLVGVAALVCACAGPPQAPERTPGVCAASPEGRRFGDWEYEGETLDGFPHGPGTKRLPSGAIDSGVFQCGVLEGEGIRFGADGEYVGEFVAGLRGGRGVMTYPDGTPLSGLWKDDVFVGPLELLWEAPDPEYGRTPERAVPVGGMPSIGRGRNNIRSYLLRLRGPEGEPVAFEFRERCCVFASANSPVGSGGQLEIYSVSYEGLGKSIDLFLNPYVRGTLAPPKDFALQ